MASSALVRTYRATPAAPIALSSVRGRIECRSRSASAPCRAARPRRRHAHRRQAHPHRHARRGGEIGEARDRAEPQPVRRRRGEHDAHHREHEVDRGATSCRLHQASRDADEEGEQERASTECHRDRQRIADHRRHRATIDEAACRDRRAASRSASVHIGPRSGGPDPNSARSRWHRPRWRRVEGGRSPGRRAPDRRSAKVSVSTHQYSSDRARSGTEQGGGAHAVISHRSRLASTCAALSAR